MMLESGGHKYEAVCQSCGKDIVYYRTWKESGNTITPKKYCDTCRPLVRAKNIDKRKRKGNYFVDNYGYSHIRINNCFVYEHRFVMEQILKRPLVVGEAVHHKNGIRTDNSPQNLEVWVKPRQLAGQRASDLLCPHCGKSYLHPEPEPFI